MILHESAVRRCGLGRVILSFPVLVLVGCSETAGPIATSPQTRPAAVIPADLTFDTQASVQEWSFSNGSEWPGAVGSLAWAADVGHAGAGSLELRYDFRNGGQYVAAIVPLPTEPPVQAVRFWVKKPAGNLLIVRAKDQDNETFQKNLSYHYPDWQQVEIRLDRWEYSWGGDGTFRGPPRDFHILVENDGGDRAGPIWIDDVQWVHTLDAEDGVARTTYVESEFQAPDPWGYSGAEGGGFQAGSWSYVLTEASGQSALPYEQGILGKPTALRLTVDSDGSGHELLARLGSHFQLFERSLGTLDRTGTMVFEVPMGDLTTWRHFGGEDDGIVRYPLRLSALILSRKGETERGTIRPRKLEFTTDYERAGETVSMVPSVQRNADGKAEFRVVLRSLADAPLAGAFHTTVPSRTSAAPATTSTPLTLPPAGRRVMQQMVVPWQPGCVEGRFQFTCAGLTTPEASVTIAEPPEGEPDRSLDPASRMGVGMYLYRFHGHPEGKEWMIRMCDLAARAGVKWTREEFHWNWIEPVQGEQRFEFFDQMVETAAEHGISVYALCCYYTAWTGPPMTDEFIEPYCAYLQSLVKRYGHRIKHWEIWNEPNIFFWPGPKDLYARLLTRAYEAIKAVDPEAQVLGCSTAGIDTGFIQMVLDHGSPFDALTIHPYRSHLDPKKFMQELRDVQKQVGGRDVWITEMGWPSHIGGLSERDQANHVSRTYVSALASGAARSVAWYDFREDGWDPYYNEHHFGLVRNDLTPKIGYRALATVGRLIGSAVFEGELSLGDDLLAFVFRRGDQRIAVLWSTAATQLVRLHVSGEGVEVFDMVGLPARCAPEGMDRVLLLERNEPVFLVGKDGMDISRGAPPVRVTLPRASAHPGESVEVRLETGPDAKMTAAVAPLGWGRSAKFVDGVAVVDVPAHATRGAYALVIMLNVGGEVFRLPVEVTVVPALLRR